MWFIVVCALINNKRASLLFSKHFFSYCFCMLSEFAKVFERKVWPVQVAHLHYAASALSSLSRCFQLSTNLDKDLFPYLWYCCKKTYRMSFKVALLKFNWFGINWHVFFTNQNAEIVVCIFLFRKSRYKPNLNSTSKDGFFPNLGGVGEWQRSEHAHAPIWGGNKGEFRDWTMYRLYKYTTTEAVTFIQLNQAKQKI